MHYLLDVVRYSSDSSSNVTFLFFVAYVKCGLYKINENDSANAAQKNVPRPNLRDIGLEWSRTSTRSCSNTI